MKNQDSEQIIQYRRTGIMIVPAQQIVLSVGGNILRNLKEYVEYLSEKRE